MNINPYEAPSADAEALEPRFNIPKEADDRIRNAVTAGLFIGTMTLMICLPAMLIGKNLFGFSAWSLIDVAVIGAMTFGVHKKSRTCAVIMLIYYAGSKIMQAVHTHSFGAVVWGLIFSYLFLMGAIGTFQYHQIKNEAERS